MPTDTDERDQIALDLLMASVRGRRLPEGRHAKDAVGEALALADAFLAATPRVYVAELAPPPGSPLDLIDEIDRIFPGEPGRARELLAELRGAVERLEVDAPARSCEGCGCAPCAGGCPGRMTAPTAAGGAPQVTPEDAVALLDAARVLVEQNIGDYTYSVREREGLGWEGPKVTAWSEASVTLEQVVKKYPPPAAPPPTSEFSDGTCPDCRTDCASWVALAEGCGRARIAAPPVDPSDDVLF